jgi:hypothetical protein
VSKVVDIVLNEKDVDESIKQCMVLNKTDLSKLILFLIGTKSPREELAALVNKPGPTSVVKIDEAVTPPTRGQVCKAFYNGQVCPDQTGCLSEHPKACIRPECKTRRSEDCTAWHTPLCKSFKRLTHCMNGDTCTARHPATCTSKDCSSQSGCALWHPKTPIFRDPKANANLGNASRRTQAGRSNSSRAKGGSKGTYVTRQLAANVRMQEKIATLEKKQVQFCPQPNDFPPLLAPHRTPSYQPPQVHNSPPAPLHSLPWYSHAPPKSLVPPGPTPDLSALFGALLPLQAALQAFLPH